MRARQSPGLCCVTHAAHLHCAFYVLEVASPAPTQSTLLHHRLLWRCRNYTHLPVTSASLPVDPAGRYDAFPHFVGFAERIKFAGGINKPKIVTGTDSEGRQHRQLVRSGGAIGCRGGLLSMLHACLNSALGGFL